MAVSTIDALYHSGSEKLTTSATGITVTGTVAATAYTGDGSALTGTGSPSIVDNGNATAMTIDSSENIGIGTSSPANYSNYTTLNLGQGGTGSILQLDGSTSGHYHLVQNNNGGMIISADQGNAVGSTTINFLTDGTERMRLDSAGKVGIGDSSPSARLEIGGMAAGEQALLIQSGRNDALSNGLARINITDSNCPFAGLQINHAGTGPALAAMGKIAVGDLNPVRFGIPSQAMIVNTSTTTTDFALHVARLTIGTENVVCISNGYGKVGSIVTSGLATSYNTSSDYRLKENVVDLTGASARVNQLNPSRFNWTVDDTNTTIDGFLAHEVATVVPEAIIGTKDAMRDEEYEVTPAVLDEDGNVTTEAVMGTRSVPDYQSIDQSKLVPLLTAALQEALTEIASLKTRVEALEA